VVCGGHVQGVYGDALRDMADKQAKKVQDQVGFLAWVVSVERSVRPHVGEPWDEAAHTE
jgi:hypothetical protein